MFRESLLKDIQEYTKSNKKAAIASIVRREAPTSGKPGDKALITPNGEVKGWIGGGCTKGIVIKEALEAIEQQTPRLVKIQPGMDAPDLPGVKNYKMTCMSGGIVEVYIEPIMPVTQIHIFGRSHIARALCEIGAAAGFNINVISELADVDMFPSASSITMLSDFELGQQLNNDYVIVCTQGEDDEKNMKAAIESRPRYLAFVASKRKSDTLFMNLEVGGMKKEDLAGIKTPAGLDINAKTPEEVAISIIAEIIKVKRSDEYPVQEKTEKTAEQKLDDDLYINPVCKIPIQKSTAKHVLEYEGEKVYFCCDGCKVSFEKDPKAYMS